MKIYYRKITNNIELVVKYEFTSRSTKYQLYCAYGEIFIGSLGSYSIHYRLGHSMLESSVCIFHKIENHDPFECEENNNCILLEILSVFSHN